MITKPLNKDKKIITIGGEKIARGERKTIQLEAAALYDYTKMTIPVEVIRGKLPGPILFISAAIHGDEINGIEVVRRILKKKIFKNLKGTLILIPIVNVYGFNHKSRYLPDRRDLNRSFPGKKEGSLASHLAYIFLKEVVSKCTHGIDLHTGSNHRTNLPHIRASLDDTETKELAQAFGVPVIVNSKLRDGSLREAARKKNVKMLLFEGGQSFRFEEQVVNTALKGCLSVMRKIGMIGQQSTRKISSKTYMAKGSFWERAPRSGLAISKKKVGDRIFIGDTLAIISDPFGRESVPVIAEEEGILIGSSLLPMVNKGDAMFHIASFRNPRVVKAALNEHDLENF